MQNCASVQTSSRRKLAELYGATYPVDTIVPLEPRVPRISEEGRGGERRRKKLPQVRGGEREGEGRGAVRCKGIFKPALCFCAACCVGLAFCLNHS